MHTRVRRVVSRVLQLPGGLQRHITYWLCHDGTPSGGVGTYYIRCHLMDRLAERVLRESMALSGDLGRDERVIFLAFDLLTGSPTPVRPENLRYLAQDLCARATSQPSADYGELLVAAKSRALDLLTKLRHEKVVPEPVVSSDS